LHGLRERSIYNAIDCFQRDGQGGAVVIGIRKTRSLWTAVLVGGWAACAAVGPRAQAADAAVAAPIPLTRAQPAAAAGATAATLAAAQRAQEFGLPTIAIGLYQELMAQPGADRAALTLPLVSALLDAGRIQEADQVLNALQSPRGPDWRLRMALVAVQEKRFDVASREIERIDVDQLTRPDRTWFWFLRGMFAALQSPPNLADADRFYTQANGEATSDAARATVLIAQERVRLRLASYTPAQVEQAKQAYEQNEARGWNPYRAAENYAVARAATGGTAEAVRFLSAMLVRLPRAEREWTDQFRLLLGLIGDRSRGGAGRYALTQLLDAGSNADKQRQALLLLADASGRDPERTLFRTELDRLISANPRSAILDGLLLMRAQLALAEHDYVTAERRANELNNRFPGSPLKPNLLGLLATSAWEQKRYRLAAENARQARELLAASPAATERNEAKVTAQSIAELRVLEAEASFRAGAMANSASDFRVGAEAYAAVLQDPPAGIKPGDLLFQRALAEIRSGAENVIKIIDELESDPRFDAANRWEAEWSLARALKTQGKAEEALQRVSRLLATPEAAAPAIAPDLRARMTWLQAQLSFDAGHPEQTLQLVQGLTDLTGRVALEAKLKGEIASTAALLKAKAEFALDREAGALETLKKLRDDFPLTDAAIYSYLVEAAHDAEPGRDRIQDAQTTLRRLIDDPRYKQSDYVPYALFQLALLSERLGTDNGLLEANARIEELVRPDRDPPAPAELVFAARLKQGDLFRLRNDFPSAQRAYEELVNNPRFAQRPDVVLAQLRLAECHNAQSATDVAGTHADLAQSIFEELLYRVDAPKDVQVEAGYNLGKLLERRGQFEKARDVWFRDVITPFLINAPRPLPAGAKRPYWLAKTLQDLGALLEQRENFDEARRVYTLLRDSGVGYENIAIERLQHLGVAAPAGLPANRDSQL
jgi:cellulose synthase operon protein C